MEKTNEIQNVNLKISEDVIIKIVEIAVSDVEGVCSLAHSRMKFTNLFSKSDLSSSVSVKVKDGAVAITVSVIVSSDCNVKKAALQIQQKIKNDVQNMTSIAVSKVNVIIDGISFEEK